MNVLASEGGRVVKSPPRALGELLCRTLGTDRPAECTDRMLIYDEAHLRAVLRTYAAQL
jgi:hypothetical protein